MDRYQNHRHNTTMSCLEKIFFGLYCICACNFALAKEPPAVRDHLGDKSYVYRPSTDRITITNSPNLKNQLIQLQANPNELRQLRKAIKAGNYVLHLYVVVHRTLPPIALQNSWLNRGRKVVIMCSFLAPTRDLCK